LVVLFAKMFAGFTGCDLDCSRDKYLQITQLWRISLASLQNEAAFENRFGDSSGDANFYFVCRGKIQ